MQYKEHAMKESQTEDIDEMKTQNHIAKKKIYKNTQYLMVKRKSEEKWT
jgi:hypothetical protein